MSYPSSLAAGNGLKRIKTQEHYDTLCAEFQRTDSVIQITFIFRKQVAESGLALLL